MPKIMARPPKNSTAVSEWPRLWARISKPPIVSELGGKPIKFNQLSGTPLQLITGAQQGNEGLFGKAADEFGLQSFRRVIVGISSIRLS